MRSTFTGLNTMVRGIFANQLSLDTVGHNITNASTEGYSRQSVNLAATMCQMQGSIYGEVAVGTGVDSTSILRARDIFADKQYRMETSTQQYNAIMQKNYEKIETVFYDTQDSGVLNAMDRFRDAWQTLSTDASNSSYRKNTVNEGIMLTNQIHTAKDQLIDQIDGLYEELSMQVDNINELTSRIITYNKKIAALEAGGSSANDLRDQRDTVVDELAKYMDVTVYENSGGYYSIVSNGITLVNVVDKLTLDLSRGGSQGTSDMSVNFGVTDFNLKIKETNTVFVAKNGSLKGIYDAIDENKSAINDLANISALLLTTFNAQHKAGYDFYGNQGGNFFGSADDPYSDYNYSEYKYNISHDEANYFYVYNGSDVLTGVEIIEELVVNQNLTFTNGEYLIAAKNDDNGSGRDELATAQGNNAVLLSDFFNMTRKYTEESNESIKDIYYQYYDSEGNTIDIYNDKITVEEGVITKELVTRNQYGTVYRLSDGSFVDDQDRVLAVNTNSESGLIESFSTTYTTRTNITYDYNSEGMLIYSGKDGTITKTLNSSGEFVYTDGRGRTLSTIDLSGYPDRITYSDGSGATYTVNRVDTPLRALGDVSIYGYYNYSVSQLGLRAEMMDLKVESQDELMVQIQNWRASTMGVDWNEELTNMIKFQKGYGACARCLTAMDEMLDRLVNNTGQVGR